MWGNLVAGEDEVALISDGPLNTLAFGEFHCLSNGRGEVDVPLLAFFALDELNLSWISHGTYLVQ